MTSLDILHIIQASLLRESIDGFARAPHERTKRDVALLVELMESVAFFKMYDRAVRLRLAEKVGLNVSRHYKSERATKQ